MAFRKKSYKRKTYKRKSYAPKKKSFKRKVMNVLARRVETKTVQTEKIDTNLYYPNQGTDFDTQNTIRMSPNDTTLPIAQGSGQGNRIGNKITTKRVMLNLTFQPTPYSAISNPEPHPMQVKIVLFYDRQNMSGMTNNADTLTNPKPRTNFFQFGNSATNISGNLTDVIAPFNKDRYAILSTKTFKLGYSRYDGSGYSIAAQAFSNNDFKLLYTCKWNITKYLPKTTKFPDSSNNPSSRGLWMQVMPAQVGATGPAGVIPLTMSYWIDYNYTDM